MTSTVSRGYDSEGLPYPRFADLVATDRQVIAAYTDAQGVARIASFDPRTGQLQWRRSFPRTALTGPLCLSSDLLFASTVSEGVLVLDLRNGERRAHLRTGADGPQPRVACSIYRVLIANNRSNWEEDIAAFDTTTFRRVWRRTIPDAYLWHAASRGDTFALLLSKPFGPGAAHSPRDFEQIVLSAATGAQLSRKPVSRPADRDLIPTTLPVAMRSWLTSLLKQKGGIYLPRTRLVQAGSRWYVGNLDDRRARAQVYAVRGPTAEILWRRAVPGLAEIARYRNRLFVASFEVRHRPSGRKVRNRLVAWDTHTGRPHWTTSLP